MAAQTIATNRKVSAMSATLGSRGEELLKGKNFCNVSTLRGDGTVQGAPAWIDVQDGQPVLNTRFASPGNSA